MADPADLPPESYSSMLLQSTQTREREQSMQDLKKELLAAAEGGSADAQLNLGVMLKIA